MRASRGEDPSMNIRPNHRRVASGIQWWKKRQTAGKDAPFTRASGS